MSDIWKSPEQDPFTPQPETLRTYQLQGRSLAEWHKYLTTDADGDPSGHLLAPCSRYGRNGDECGWWAIACQVIFVAANGDDMDTEVALDYYQGLAVNDIHSVGVLVLDYYDDLPSCLQEVLGTREEVRELTYGG